MIKGVRVKYLLSSSLWITVLIVRVGCIIEAQASTVDVASLDHTSITKESKEDLSSSSLLLVRQNGVNKKKVMTGSRPRHFSSQSPISQLSTGVRPTTTINTFLTDDTVDDGIDAIDSCTSKPDGYFPNYGSDCTSYYFCAAGYQITYICPPGSRFDEKIKKCGEEVKCHSPKGFKNLCRFLNNGYYPNEGNPRKYFYCFNNAKVIDLMCDEGKIFIGNKCTLAQGGVGERAQGHNSRVVVATGNEPETEATCTGKPNGFYLILNSACNKYYFCVGGSKTELKCQLGFVFNGDLCVRPQRYKCPESLRTHDNSLIVKSSSSSGSSARTSRNSPSISLLSNVSSSSTNLIRKTAPTEDKIYLTSEPTSTYFDSTSLPTTTVG